jgi:hypothetical protein
MASDSDSDSDIEFEIKTDSSYILPGGKFYEDLDYMRDNIDREKEDKGDLFYKKKTSGCNVSKWNRDDPDAGDTVEYGIADVEGHEGITEMRSQLGKIRWGKVANKNQIGATLEYVGAKTEVKVGPVDMTATALEGSYTAALGRNTGIMVKTKVYDNSDRNFLNIVISYRVGSKSSAWTHESAL